MYYAKQIICNNIKNNLKKLGIKDSSSRIYEVLKEMIIDDKIHDESKKPVNNNMTQNQKAGKNSEQVQIGRNGNGK